MKTPSNNKPMHRMSAPPCQSKLVGFILRRLSTAHNAGWRAQFRFAVCVLWSGVCDFHRWAILHDTNI